MPARFDYALLKTSGRFYDTGKHIIVTKASLSVTSIQDRIESDRNTGYGSRTFYHPTTISFYKAKEKSSSQARTMWK
jgi:hypothetical protein